MAAVQKNMKSAVDAEADQKIVQKVFKPRPKDAGITVAKDGEAFVLHVPDLERLTAGPGAGPSELSRQIQRQLTRRGLTKELEKAGVKSGSKVRCGELEWEW